MTDNPIPHPLLNTTLCNQGQSTTTVETFNVKAKMSIQPLRQPNSLPSSSDTGFTGIQHISVSSGLSRPAAMEKSLTDTAFFALSSRVSPNAHLQILRGRQDELLLHTAEFMSPALHNSSDTYHRHIRSQLFYSSELCQGRHQQQWLTRTKQRQPFINFATHIDYHAYAFLPGYRLQKEKEDYEHIMYGERMQAYLFGESEGMRSRGWVPEDWAKIQRSINSEYMKAAKWRETRRSFDSIDTSETDVSIVFEDDEEDENTDDEAEFNHLYAFDDGKSDALRTEDEDATIKELTDLEQNITSIQKPTTVELDTHTRYPNNADSPKHLPADCLEPKYTYLFTNEYKNDLFDSPSPLLVSWCCRPEDDSDSEEEDENEGKSDNCSDEDSDHSEELSSSTNLQPSALLANWCYRPCDDSDSDGEPDEEENETSTPNNPSLPTSLYTDSSTILDTISEATKVKLSLVLRRKRQFLDNLQSVRTQVKLDMDAAAEREAIEENKTKREEDRKTYQSKLVTTLVSLRLHMSSNGLISAKQQNKTHFKNIKDVAKHEVEFKGSLAANMKNQGAKGLGNIVERGFWNAEQSGEWAMEMADYGRAYEVMRAKQYLAVKAENDEVAKSEMRTVVEMAQAWQYRSQEKAKEIILDAIWEDDEPVDVMFVDESTSEIRLH